MRGPSGAPICDGWCDKTCAVTSIDEKGYTYCRPCGDLRKKSGILTRLMRPFEIEMVSDGHAIWYAMKPKRFYTERQKDGEA